MLYEATGLKGPPEVEFIVRARAQTSALLPCAESSCALCSAFLIRGRPR